MPGFLSTYRNLKNRLLQYPLAVMVLFCIITRLPQLISPHLLLDPDECITAMMAKKLMQGKDFSLFFWGQQYGLTIIESAIIIPFYWLLGTGTLAVKLAMLSLWTIGVIYLYKFLTLIHKGDNHNPLLLTLLFTCLPAWAVFSMNAWGGTITAFTISSLFLYQLFLPKKSFFYWIILGLLLELVYEAKLLWLIGILPIFIYKMILERNAKKILTISATIFIFFVAFSIYKRNIFAVYKPVFLPPDEEHFWPYICRYPFYQYQSFTGYYYFDWYQTPDTPSHVLAICSCILMGLLVLSAIYLLVRKRKDAFLFFCTTLFVFGLWMASTFTEHMEGRYLLPASGFIIIALCLADRFLIYHKVKRIVYLTLILIGFCSMMPFYYFDVKAERKQELYSIINALERHKIPCSFSKDCMLPWQIIYYSNERLISCIPFYPGRYKPYYDSCEQNLKSGGRNAIIGYKDSAPKADSNNIILFKEFYINLAPKPEEIRKDFFIH